MQELLDLNLYGICKISQHPHQFLKALRYVVKRCKVSTYADISAEMNKEDLYIQAMNMLKTTVKFIKASMYELEGICFLRNLFVNLKILNCVIFKSDITTRPLHEMPVACNCYPALTGYTFSPVPKGYYVYTNLEDYEEYVQLEYD
jgi:hypothetical protein